MGVCSREDLGMTKAVRREMSISTLATIVYLSHGVGRTWVIDPDKKQYQRLAEIGNPI